MAIKSRAKHEQTTVFAKCEEMGEAAVLSDLERAGVDFASSEQKWLAWEWVYSQRLKREEAQSGALRATARWTLLVAGGTFLVALFTFLLVWAEQCSKH